MAGRPSATAPELTGQPPGCIDASARRFATGHGGHDPRDGDGIRPHARLDFADAYAVARAEATGVDAVVVLGKDATPLVDRIAANARWTAS